MTSQSTLHRPSLEPIKMRPDLSKRAHYTTYGRLAVEVHENRKALGTAAARAVAGFLHGTIARRGQARVIFACAPSQNEFLAALIDPAQTGIRLDWSKITAFHMDEYVGIAAEHPQSFRHYLRKHLVDQVALKQFHPIEAERSDATALCTRYASLLLEDEIDLICLGIGENGHIAFNDPGVADFEDPVLVKQVVLDEECRQQQVNDGCFPDLGSVPLQAITLTIPVFRRARCLSIHAPGVRKAAAAAATLTGEITPLCPASILRLHPNATLYIDTAAASHLVLP